MKCSYKIIRTPADISMASHRFAVWDAHTSLTSSRNKTRTTTLQSYNRRPGRPQSSNGLLQGSNTEGLDHCFGRLCLHHDYFAKHLLFAYLGRRLLTSLDHAKPRNGEFPGCLHLLRRNLSKAVEHLDAI